jgi:hypothetical protein
MPCSIRCSTILLGRIQGGITNIRACTCVESTHLIGRLVLTKYAPYAIIPVQMLRETCDNRNEARAGLKVVANYLIPCREAGN